MSRLPWRWTDYNHPGYQNTFQVKGGKRKTTKGVSRCHGYHENCWWNLWRGAGERLCSLQKMDQRVIQQKFDNPSRVRKLHSEGSKKLPTWECFTFQWLGYCWDW